jgi:hypothetical protein
MTWSIMNCRGHSQLKTPRLGERIAILSHREADDSLPGKSDIIEKMKMKLFEERALDHGIQRTKARSEIEMAQHPQKAIDCSVNASIKTSHDALLSEIASQMIALLLEIKRTPPIV